MPDAPISPFIPEISTEDEPGTDGRIGSELSDFQVDEVPLYLASGEGEHLYVRIRKQGMTTRDAARAIAAAASVPISEIGTAGMKDKHGVTTQWMSLPARPAKPVDAWVLPETLHVEEATRHKNKLRTGHLKGNRFRIRIVDTAPGALALSERILALLRERGLPNYFGAQRFGRDGGNVAEAAAWIAGEAPGGARRRVAPFERKLFASVLQSDVFNRYAAARIAEGLERPLAGEVVRLDGSGASFCVEDVERELARWTARDVHPTGPMIGPKMRPAHGRPRELEDAAVASVGLGPEGLAALARFADGTRRDLLLFFGTTADGGSGSGSGSGTGDVKVFEDQPGENTLVLEFFLPSGSYATVLVRELTREPFFGYRV